MSHLKRAIDRLRIGNRVKILFFTLPPICYLAVFFIIPFIILFWISFWRVEFLSLIPTWSLESWKSFITYPKVFSIMLSTIRIAATITIITFILGYPFAYYLSFKVSGHKQTILALSLVFPFLVGVICRTYAWRVLLGSEGVINSFLLYTKIIKEPLAILLFSEPALYIVLIYNYILLMVFPIFLSMQRIDPRLLEASADLGATPLKTFLKVTLPLSMPGVLAGAIFVFISVCGVYVEPVLIGGKDVFLLANLIEVQFGAANQWPLGAAIGITMLVIVMTLCIIFIKFVGLEKIFRG
ncbi:ABC transporter permease [Candidatus Bathyarchaeota archaeon]|nr:ABC transporter permease [Candidatus Bathyarchaeota archaeon]